MKKILILISLLPAILFSEQFKAETFSASEVKLVEKGILENALKLNDYPALMTMGVGFLNSSKRESNPVLAKELREKALYLLKKAHKGGEITASSLLFIELHESSIEDSMLIGREAIASRVDNESARLNKVYIDLVFMYVSAVLDNYIQDKRMVSFAIEALQRLPEETPNGVFYQAFLFQALDMQDMANMYLDSACRTSKPDSKIREFCMTSEFVTTE